MTTVTMTTDTTRTPEEVDALVEYIGRHAHASHTRDAIRAALARGERAWMLSSPAGDDVLLGATEAEVERDVRAHHGEGAEFTLTEVGS